jgi:hypothetical protein
LDGDSEFEPEWGRDGNPNYQEYWNGSDPWSWDPAPAKNFPDSPGCYYWGEADGDGIPQAQDKTTLANAIAGLPANYSKVIPSPMVQDLDGDSTLQVQDLTIIKSFILNLVVGPVSGRAASLEPVYSPPGPVLAGSTTHVTVRVRNENGSINHYSPGFSVVFSIDAINSTGSALLLGGDGAYGEGTRLDVSGPGGHDDGGHATIHLKITGPGTIIVHAVIPSCGTTGVGKWVDEISLDPPITITAQ